MTARTFDALGIFPDAGGRAVCPQCSADRRKHGQRCLSVDTDQGIFYCFHCGWKGALKGRASFNIHDLSAIRRKRDQGHKQAGQRAARIWDRAHDPDPAHTYLVNKQIEPRGIRQRGSYLLVPVYDGERLSSLQSIGPDGSKKFLPGARVKGCYFKLDGEGDRVLICEGYATAATLHWSEGSAVYAALSASNLVDVAVKVRVQHPVADILICADHDDAGIRYGKLAAARVEGWLCYPPEPGQDYNDYARGAPCEK